MEGKQIFFDVSSDSFRKRGPDYSYYEIIMEIRRHVCAGLKDFKIDYVYSTKGLQKEMLEKISRTSSDLFPKASMKSMSS